jgi:hypothetical protein
MERRMGRLDQARIAGQASDGVGRRHDRPATL